MFIRPKDCDVWNRRSGGAAGPAAEEFGEPKPPRAGKNRRERDRERDRERQRERERSSDRGHRLCRPGSHTIALPHCAGSATRVPTL